MHTIVSLANATFGCQTKMCSAGNVWRGAAAVTTREGDNRPRNAHLDECAASLTLRDLHDRAVQRGLLYDQREAEPGAARVAAAAARESLQHTLAIGGRDAGSVVAHGQPPPLSPG